MRRFLVVAHQTLSSPELLEEMTSRAGEGETTFHLLVPVHHGEPGLTWTEGHDRGGRGPPPRRGADPVVRRRTDGDR